MTQAVEDFFAGGVTAAKFEDRAYGSVIGGEIMVDPRMQQQRDYESGEPLTYPDGNPQMQMVVVVQAYAPNGDDDGQRAFYIKGQMRQAVGEALRKVGAKAPARGGKLWIKYTEDKPTTLKNGRPGNPQKIYVAKYDAPAQAAAGAYFDDAPATTQPGAAQAAPQSAAPATSYAAAPAHGAGNGRAVRRTCPLGVDPTRWAAMDDAQQAQMYDALGLPHAVAEVASAAAAPAYDSTPHGGPAFAGEPPF